MLILNESVFRQYVVGYRAGKPAVLWLNVHDFKEAAGDGSTTISFIEAGETYNYVGSSTTGYKEINNKAPFITSYELMDEAEIEKRGYIQQFADVLGLEDDESEEVEDSEDWYNPNDYDPDAWTRNCGGGHGCGGGYHRHYGCGGGGGCGGYSGGC